MSTVNDVLAGMNADKAHLEKIENSLFEVQKLQLTAPLEGYDSPQMYGVYKATGGKALGVMGEQFNPMQPKEFYDNIVNTAHENGVDLDLQTLKFTEYKGGEFIEFSIALPVIEFTNARKVNDVTEMKLTFTTSYNGSKANQISLFTNRLICTNGMVAWGRNAEATLKAKNTTGGKNKILTYGNEVMKVMAGAEDYKAKIIALNNVKVSKKVINDYLSSLLKYDVTDVELHPISRKYVDLISESIELELERTGDTMFGLLNGITHFTNHVANNSKIITNDEYIRFHSGATMNTNAQKFAFEYLN